MASLRSIPGISDLIERKIVHECKTHKQVSEDLKRLFPGQTGLSTRSVRRFCCEEGIRRTSRVTDTQLDRVVANTVAKVNAVWTFSIWLMVVNLFM